MNVSTIAVTASLGLWPALALAHNEWGVANPSLNDPEYNVREEIAALRSAQTDENARFVMERAQLWTPGTSLVVCFKDGTAAQRTKIVDAVTNMRLGTT